MALSIILVSLALVLVGSTGSIVQDSSRGTGSTTATASGSAVHKDQTGSAVLKNQMWPDARVWAHVIPQGLPEYSNSGTGQANIYGDLYPLDLVQGDAGATQRPTSGVARALQAGVTGVQVLQFDTNNGSDFVDTWLSQADPTWRDADPNNDFMVAPSLQVSSVDNAVRLIKQYDTAARGHPSAGVVHNKLIIYVYDTKALSPDQWRDVRIGLGGLNNSIYMIANLDTSASQTGRELDTNAITPYLPVFEASFTFDDSVEYIWNPLIDYLNGQRRQYAGGIQPGSDRQTCANDEECGHVDALATARYRSLWELALQSGTSWQNVLTWNDVVERTEVEASSSWNHTRSDITAFYSAKLRKIPFPRPVAELYITTPQMIEVGTPVAAEGLVLNGSARKVRLEIHLVDSKGVQVGDNATAVVPPANSGAAVTSPEAGVVSRPPGGFYRAESRVYDSETGELLQRVTSAPVVVVAKGEQPTPSFHRLYYSIPARLAMQKSPTLTVSGSPLSPAGGVAKVQTMTDTPVRFNEVLQNTRQVANGFTDPAFSVRVPMQRRTIVGGQVTSASPEGAYVGRVIDEEERVGYSDPVVFPSA